MALETAAYIHQLEPSNPAGPDRLANGDDHLRMIKACLKATFPNINGPTTVTPAQLNALSSSAVPFGLVMLWYGSLASIPAGYAICDGASHPKTGGGTVITPNLIGRVPIGAGTGYATGTSHGANSKTVTSGASGAHGHTGTIPNGGGHNHTIEITPTVLSIAQMPAHSHSITVHANSGTGSFIEDADSSGGTGTTQTSSQGGGASHTHTGSTPAGGGAHDHTVTISDAIAHSHGVTVDVMQSSLALYYIMKV